MYEDLMIDLDLCARGEKTGYHTAELCGLAYSAIKTLTAQLSALQSENADLHAALSRVEAERDALLEYANAQMECEMCKNDTFCPMENPMPENCALCELKPKCPCHPCKWEWRGAQGEA